MIELLKRTFVSSQVDKLDKVIIRRKYQVRWSDEERSAVLDQQG